LIIVSLAAPELGDALKRFVEKDERMSLADTYNVAIAATQAAAIAELTAPVASAADGVTEDKEPDGDDVELKRVVHSVSTAGRRLQAQASAKFADGDARLRSAQNVAQREAKDGAQAGTAQDDTAGAHWLCTYAMCFPLQGQR
jgi:hypothetical protein